ncbi:hypothetical protein [Cupriavidus respiraculi]|nr:hypothetical protein [Cupriavidus respiraculi]
MQAAFDAIMGDRSMPDQNDPGYDRWLFDRAYAAGMERAAVIAMEQAKRQGTLGRILAAESCAAAIRAEIKETTWTK